MNVIDKWLWLVVKSNSREKERKLAYYAFKVVVYSAFISVIVLFVFAIISDVYGI